MRTSILLCLVLGACAVMGQYVAYEYVDAADFEVMGRGGGGFGYGGFGGKKGGNVQYVQPIVQQLVAAPIVQQPVYAKAQPVMQQQKSVTYAQPIVTYAQPIVQQVDMTAPVMQKQTLTAQPIVQATYQTAPVQLTQAITATAPTIQKGFGAGLGLGKAGFGGY